MVKLCGGRQWGLSKMFLLSIKISDSPPFTISKNLPANNKFKHTHTVKDCGVLQWLCLEAGQSITELCLLSLALLLLLLLGSLLMPILWSAPDGIRRPVKLTKPSWVRTKTVCRVENGHVWPFAPLPSAPPAFFFFWTDAPAIPKQVISLLWWSCCSPRYFPPQSLQDLFRIVG